MRLFRLIAFFVAVLVAMAAVVNVVRIEGQADLSAVDRHAAIQRYFGAPMIGSSVLFAVAAYVQSAAEWFRAKATNTAKPVHFAFSDPARGVTLAITLTDTELAKSDTEGRKKIGAVLEHYGSGGAA